jgi:hypothetical protein
MTNGKGFGRKRSWTNFKALSRNSPLGTERIHENLNQDSGRQGRDFNQGRPIGLGTMFLRMI